jgi:hypothetical protein
MTLSLVCAAPWASRLSGRTQLSFLLVFLLRTKSNLDLSVFFPQKKKNLDLSDRDRGISEHGPLGLESGGPGSLNGLPAKVAPRFLMPAEWGNDPFQRKV